MARPAQRGSQPAPRRLAEDGDICPVCKSSRYLNPNMRFLVNPECYHKMCESCVDRIFSHGPAPCPIARCGRTLRKQKFRKQTFEDIQVEREVDIRRRVAKIFNKTEDDFNTLLDYNNYLNEVEDITFNLVSGIDIDDTEKRLAAYAEANRVAGLRHAREVEELRLGQPRQGQERARRDVTGQDEEEQQRESQGRKQHLSDKSAADNGDTANAPKEGQRVTLKKTSGRRSGFERQKHIADDSLAKEDSDEGLKDLIQFKGLKERKDSQPKEIYDPFAGLRYQHSYYALQSHYDWRWLDEARNDARYGSGGYNLEEYYARALSDAFSGLGVFVRDETGSKEENPATETTLPVRSSS